MCSTKVLIFIAIFGFAVAVEEVPILHQESEIEPDGAYKYSFETGDGVKASAAGSLKTVENEVVGVAQGAYSYTGDDGNTYSVNYVADENGYQPSGEHIHPVPVAIKKALDYLATAPPPKQ